MVSLHSIHGTRVTNIIKIIDNFMKLAVCFKTLQSRLNEKLIKPSCYDKQWNFIFILKQEFIVTKYNSMRVDQVRAPY